MSIVTLKRNSSRYIAPISHNQGRNGFSLNGGLRNAGWVGQTSLARIGSAKPCCVYQDPSIIKMSTRADRYTDAFFGGFNSSLTCNDGKCNPLFGNISLTKKYELTNDHTASGQTESKANATICVTSTGCSNQTDVINNPTDYKSTIAFPSNGICRANSYRIGGRLVYNKPFNKDSSDFSAMSAGDYIQRLKKPATQKYPE
jgi:hypothetical protein